MPEPNTNNNNECQHPPQADSPGADASQSRNPIIQDLLEAYKIQLDIWKMQNDNYFKRIQFVMIAIQVALFAGLVAVLDFRETSLVQPVMIIILSVLGVCSMAYVVTQNNKKMQYLEFSRRNLRNIEYKLIELEVPLGYFTAESIAFFKSGSKSLDIPKSDAIAKSKDNPHTVEFLMSKESYPEKDTCKKEVHEYSEVKGKMIGVDALIAKGILLFWVLVFIVAILLPIFVPAFRQSPTNERSARQQSAETIISDSNKALLNQTGVVSSPPVVNIQMPETIQVKNVSNESETVLDFCRKNIPWIIAIAMVLVNIWMSIRLVKSNEKNIKRQLDNAKEIALQEFRTTHVTGNRIDWIACLRDCISEFISTSVLVTIEIKNKSTDINKFHAYLEKITLNSTKIQLFLNLEKTDQKNLSDAIINVTNEFSKPSDELKPEETGKAIRKVIDTSRKLFQNHWEKIKKLQ